MKKLFLKAIAAIGLFNWLIFDHFTKTFNVHIVNLVFGFNILFQNSSPTMQKTYDSGMNVARCTSVWPIASGDFHYALITCKSIFGPDCFNMEPIFTIASLFNSQKYKNFIYNIHKHKMFWINFALTDTKFFFSVWSRKSRLSIAHLSDSGNLCGCLFRIYFPWIHHEYKNANQKKQLHQVIQYHLVDLEAHRWSTTYHSHAIHRTTDVDEVKDHFLNI